MKQDIEVASRIEREKVIQELHVAYKIHKDHKHYIISSAAIQKYAVPLFKVGAEWQSKQSPWISVKERLPEPNKLVLCRMVSNGAIVSGYIVVSPGRSPYVATDGGFEFEDWNDYECDMWMPIPSFDDILEANKDVLERIKEKGD